MLPSENRKRFLLFLSLSLLVHFSVLVYFAWHPLVLEKKKFDPETTTVEIKLKDKKEEEKKKAEEKKAEEKKAEEKKAEEKKAEEKKAEEKKAEEKKAEEKKAESKKAEEKKTEPKKEEPKKEEPKKAEPKKEEPKKEEPKKAEPKKEEPKKEEPKKAEPKKEEPKKEEPKKAEPKKEEPKKEEPKKAEPKKTEPKKEDPSKAAPQKAEPKKVEPKKEEPKQGKPKQGEPGKGEPSKALKPDQQIPKSEISKDKPSTDPDPRSAEYWIKRLGSMKTLDDRSLERTVVSSMSLDEMYGARNLSGELALMNLNPFEKHEYDKTMNDAMLLIEQYIHAPKKDGRKYYGEINFYVSEDGVIEKVALKIPSGHDELDQAMMLALINAHQIRMPTNESARKIMYLTRKKLFYSEQDMR